MLKAQASVLPNDLLTPTAFVQVRSCPVLLSVERLLSSFAALQVHERARFLLAAELLKEKQLKSDVKTQNIALALFLGAIVDHCDALQVPQCIVRSNQQLKEDVMLRRDRRWQIAGRRPGNG